MEPTQRPDHPLLAARTGNLRRRRAVNRGMEISAWTAAVLAVAVLVLVIGSVAVKGLSSISLDFLTQNADPNSIEASGGIANALVGTGIMVGLATLMAVPVGILTAIYTNEFAGSRSASTIRYFLDVLNGVPTIVTGIFIFGLIVTAQGHQSGWAAAIALGIVMLPLVARSCQEVLALVPGSVKEAGLALGASRWRTTVSVVVPTALSGMITGALLAVARALGETAPLLILSSIPPLGMSTDPSQPLSSVPLIIFQYSESATPAKHDQAWAAALVLIAIVLLISIVARTLSARARRRLGAAR
jgi:phosphate transport system permease protein